MEEVVKHRIDQAARDVYDCTECGTSFTSDKWVCEAECPKCCGEGEYPGGPFPSSKGPMERCDLCDGEGVLRDQVIDSDVVRFCVACGAERWQFDIEDKATVTRKDGRHGQTATITKLPDPTRAYLVKFEDGAVVHYNGKYLQYEEV